MGEEKDRQPERVRGEGQLSLLGELLASGAIEVSEQAVTLRLAGSGVTGSFSCGCPKADDPASTCRVVISENTVRCGGGCLEGGCTLTVVIGPTLRTVLPAESITAM